VLTPDEARKLLDSIDVTTAVGLRDRALIGMMAYSFARVSAAVAMRVEDYYAWFAELRGTVLTLSTHAYASNEPSLEFHTEKSSLVRFRS
jgi:integrase